MSWVVEFLQPGSKPTERPKKCSVFNGRLTAMLDAKRRNVTRPGHTVRYIGLGSCAPATHANKRGPMHTVNKRERERVNVCLTCGKDCRFSRFLGACSDCARGKKHEDRLTWA